MNLGVDKININYNGFLVVIGDVRGNVKVYVSVDFLLFCYLYLLDNIFGIFFSLDLWRFYDMCSFYGIVWEFNMFVRLVEKFEYFESNIDLDYMGDNDSLVKFFFFFEYSVV